MAVQIARPSDMMMRDPMQGPQYRPNPTQQQKPEPSAMQQFGQMAQNRAMESALDTGATMMQDKVMAPAGEALTGMFSSAAPTAASTIGGTGMGSAGVLGAELGTAAAGAGTGAAGAGMMATIGTAMPYVGAGILAGKALGLFSEGGQVGPLYADEGTRGIEQQLETGRRQDMSKGPLGFLELFVKGIDTLTGYDRANEKRAALPEGKKDMLINKRRNPYTGEYPITEEEYQQVISEGMTEAVQEGIHPILQPGYFDQGGNVKPTYANMGLGPLALEKMKEQDIPMGGLVGLASAAMSGGGTAISFQDQLAAWKANQMDEYLGEKDKIESEIEQGRYKYGGGMAGPLSKIEYKSAGGETYKLSYGGPISKGA